MGETNWEAMAEWQHIILKKVYAELGEQIDDIYNSGMGLNEYGAALRMYEKLVPPSETPLYDTWEKSKPIGGKQMSSSSELPTDEIEWCIGLHYHRRISQYNPTNPATEQLQALIDEVERLQQENKLLHATLTDAKDALVEWGGYASPYFKNKWNLETEIKTLEDVLTETKQGDKQ